MWPSRRKYKEMCVIKVLPIITQDREIQKLPSKVVEIVNDWLDELRSDIKNESKKR